MIRFWKKNCRSVASFAQNLKFRRVTELVAKNAQATSTAPLGLYFFSESGNTFFLIHSLFYFVYLFFKKKTLTEYGFYNDIPYIHHDSLII